MYMSLFFLCYLIVTERVYCFITFMFLFQLKGAMGIEVMSKTMEEENDRGVSKIGSNPPSCEHK